MRFQQIKEYFSLLLTIILLHVRFTGQFFIFAKGKEIKLLTYADEHNFSRKIKLENFIHGSKFYDFFTHSVQNYVLSLHI